MRGAYAKKKKKRPNSSFCLLHGVALFPGESVFFVLHVFKMFFLEKFSEGG